MSIFKEARINADLSVEDVSSRLNIRKHYIIAIEENRLNDIPSGVYAQGYIKMYAKLLGLDTEGLVDIKPHVEDNEIYNNVIEFTSRNNIGIATAAILILIIAAWIYMVAMPNTEGATDMLQNLENVEPTNYMLNINNAASDQAHSVNVDFKLPNIKGVSDGFNEQNNK